MLAMSASAAVDAHEGQKTQWAPTGVDRIVSIS